MKRLSDDSMQHGALDVTPSVRHTDGINSQDDRYDKCQRGEDSARVPASSTD